MAEEEEKVPEAKKNFDENLDDQDGLRIADQKDDQLSNNDIEEDGPKKVLTFAESPSKKETFGRLSQINQSKPITSENKVDITFAEEVFQK